MDGGGFEPPKQIAADLQSVPFGHSGIHPYGIVFHKADDRTRTDNLLITNQLLCQLSHIGIHNKYFIFSDSDGNRTRVTAVKGRCLNRLTTGPYAVTAIAVTVDYNIILSGRMQEVFLFFISAFCFFLFMAYLRMTLK